ncbi:hypothetical protein ABVK25_012091 [Lepraria finkii]|uniref:FAR-17a/AIG1-like protein n=1 Tax=Lepraria finkii TaxID=1340010 RepID=A0ABR4AI45_9LECA
MAESPRKYALRKVSSPSLYGFSALIHFLGLSSFTFSYVWLVDNPTPINGSYGWHFQYLTIIGLTIATFSFTAGALADLTSSIRLFHIKNALSICSTPLEVLVSMLYWSLRVIDKDLVIPDWAQLPLFADLSFHAIPQVLLLVDFLLLSPPWRVTVTQAMGLSSAFAMLYWLWVQKCFEHNGFYPYPIFGMFGLYGRIGLFILSTVTMTANTVALKWLYGMVNETELKRRQ